MQQDEKRYIFCTHYSAYGVVTESDWNDVMVKRVSPSIRVHFKNGQNGETAKRLPDDYNQAIPRVYIQETTKEQYDNA